jgi:hypothetical protein
LVDVKESTGAVEPEHRACVVPKLNVGVTIGLTVTVNVAMVIHSCGAFEGVNVYVPLVVLLTTAGLHVPLYPLSEVVGNVGTVPPEQIVNVVPIPNVGATLGVTVTDKIKLVAHCPAPAVYV